MARNGIWLLVWLYLLSTAAEEPRCPRWATAAQCREDGSASDEYFYSINGTTLQVTYGEKYLHFTCPDNVSLENEVLPRFSRLVEISFVKLSECAAPAHGYVAALLALNVSVGARLELDRLPARPALRAQHLRGLALDTLVLSAAAEPLQPDPAFVEPLADLKVLQLTNVLLTQSTTLLLPKTLRSLNLRGAGLANLPADTFARLPELERLEVRDELLHEVDLGETRALRSVFLTAPLDGVTLGPSVVNVSLFHVRSAALLGNCTSLRKVVVNNLSEALPASWLAACPAVDTVRVSCGARGGLAGADELRGARALRELQVRSCALQDLPAAWLADAPALIRLDLSSNKLERLPSELVSAAPKLAMVELAGNRLTRAAVTTLAALPALQNLSLDSNPLADLCGSSDTILANALSPLWKARGLRTLKLSRTGLSRICRDWRTELVRLSTLDLSHNNVSLLEFDDLQWRRELATEVDLRHNPIRDVRYTRDQFTAVLAGNASDLFPSSQMTTLVLDRKLQCDCAAYWYVRAITERPRHPRAALRDALCVTEAGRAVPLSAAPPHELLCPLPAELGRCPAGCACLVSGESSELRCAGAGLRRLPRAPPGLPARALLLPRNKISHIALEDITPDLKVLDLSDNLITSVDAATTTVLFGTQRSVLLAGNPLRCDCGALSLLRALAAQAAREPGTANVTCAGGDSAPVALRRLSARCAPAVWPYVLAALALAAASAVAAGCLTRPVARQRFKRFLFERGLCLRWLLRPLPEADDDGRPFDGFVSFSHLDAQFAAELALRLERGAGLRLCLHDRDWAPGEWIPAQIAQSVRRSRRTLVLLSERFLASQWARAELREAYAAALREQRPRLLLLLLPGLAPERAAAADPDLRAYLASVTYLQWEDPRFWDKLLLAMPRPRAPPAPSAPPAAPAPAARAPPPPP